MFSLIPILNHDLYLQALIPANNDEGDFKTPISRHLMAFNDSADTVTIKETQHDCYEQKQKSYAAWAKTHPAELKENGFYKIE